MSVIGRRLKEARQLAEFSQEQLGLLAGLEVESASARMNRYERGTRVPDFALLARIGSVLKLPVTYFYAEDDDEAELLVKYYRMSPDKKVKTLNLVRDLSPRSDG